MLTLVYGGSGSGKSVYAEEIAVKCRGPRYYIATMEPFGKAAQDRIRKHRRQRSDKGFQTFECYTGLDSLRLPERGTVLLECMGNLTANELFSPKGAGKDAFTQMKTGLESLLEQSNDLIVVSNDVFREGTNYQEETLEYLKVLGELNRFLAQKAERVAEVVCGIPLAVKGELL